MTLGEKLKEERKQTGLSQEQYSDKFVNIKFNECTYTV